MIKLYNSANKQYVFKQSSGKVWNFYHDNSLGLCYSTLTRKNTWTEPVSIQKNTHQSFYADIDSEDRFHILFQDGQGNIFYTLLEDDSIKTVPVLNSKTPTSYNKYLHLIPLNNIHFFYILQHNNNTILAHQVLSEGAVSTPRVIDYVMNNSCPYCAICDKLNNVYVFYQSFDGKHLQIGYKKFIPLQKFWGEFIPITKFSGDCEFPRAIIDNNNVIHICCQRRSARHHELVYQQKVPDRNMWTNEVIIHSSAYPFESSSIVYINEAIIMYWVRDDIIYYSSSNDGGSTWSKPSRYNFPAGRQLFCLSYSTNTPSEAGKIAVRDIPGSFINGLRLAFYHDVLDRDSNLSPDELRNMIVESLKLLKGSVEELKEADTGIREDISKLTLIQQSLEKELTKYSVKLNLIENEISQVKSISSRLEKYNNALSEYKSKLEPELLKINELKSGLISELTQSSIIHSITADIRNLQNEISKLRNDLYNKAEEV